MAKDKKVGRKKKEETLPLELTMTRAELSWELLHNQIAGDREHLKKHGLDVPLRLAPDQTDWSGTERINWGEVARQVQYLLEKGDKLPRTVMVRKALSLLTYYMKDLEQRNHAATVGWGERGGITPIVFLLGNLLGASLTPIKYSKRTGAHLKANELFEQHPELSNRQIADAVGVHPATVGRWKSKRTI